MRLFFCILCLISGISAISIFYFIDSEFVYERLIFLHEYAIYLVNIIKIPPTAYNNLASIFLGVSVLSGYLSTKLSISSEVK